MKATFNIGPVEQEIFWELGIHSNKVENELRWASLESPERTNHLISHEIEWREQSSDSFKKKIK
jgi:hypothetical protein